MISLENVSNRLWDKQILRNISWSTKFEQSWAILGPNGAGKSMLIKIILGQIPYSGTIKRHQKMTDLKKIAHVSFEQQKLISVREEKKDRYEEFSGKEQHYLTGRELMDPTGEHSKDICKISEPLGLSKILEKPLRYFSNGEVRKTLICKALLAEPQLMILDEPFDGLDKASVRWLTETISGLINRGLPIWLVSHMFEEIVPEITHILCLKSGEIFAKGLRRQILTPKTMKMLFDRKNSENFSNKNDKKIEIKNKKFFQHNFANKLENNYQYTQIIKMLDVNIKYGDKVVLKKFNWTVRKGENWKIVGPNGAGKSTLLSLITGDNLQAYSNEIYLFGRRRGSGESVWEIKKKIGLISPEFQLLYRESISVIKVVISGFFDTIGIYNHYSERQSEIALNWLKFLEIDDLAENNFTRLSYGQQRLVLIARAMIKSPPLLIFDEPCQGLDFRNRNKILEVIDKIGNNFSTQILYVTHVASDKLKCLNQELRFEVSKKGTFKATKYSIKSNNPHL